MRKLRFPHAFTDSKDKNICTKTIQREKLWYNFPIVTEVILENKLFLSKRSIFRITTYTVKCPHSETFQDFICLIQKCVILKCLKVLICVPGYLTKTQYSVLYLKWL